MKLTSLLLLLIVSLTGCREILPYHGQGDGAARADGKPGPNPVDAGFPTDGLPPTTLFDGVADIVSPAEAAVPCVAAWCPESFPTQAQLRGIWGTGPDDLYAVGTGTTILHRTATGWTQLTSLAATGDFNDVSGMGKLAVVVGRQSGDVGLIIELTGLPPSQQSTSYPKVLPLAAVSCGQGTCFAAGPGSALLRRGPSGWVTAINPGVNLNLTGVGITQQSVFLVGATTLKTVLRNTPDQAGDWLPLSGIPFDKLSIAYAAVFADPASPRWCAAGIRVPSALGSSTASGLCCNDQSDCLLIGTPARDVWVDMAVAPPIVYFLDDAGSISSTKLIAASAADTVVNLTPVAQQPVVTGPLRALWGFSATPTTTLQLFAVGDNGTILRYQAP